MKAVFFTTELTENTEKTLVWGQTVRHSGHHVESVMSRNPVVPACRGDLSRYSWNPVSEAGAGKRKHSPYSMQNLRKGGEPLGTSNVL